MTRNRPSFVADTSGAVKGYRRAEPDIEVADRVLDDCQQGRTMILAPDQIRDEVPIAIRDVLRAGQEIALRGRLKRANVLALSISTTGDGALIAAGHEQAVRFGCSS